METGGHWSLNISTGISTTNGKVDSSASNSAAQFHQWSQTIPLIGRRRQMATCHIAIITDVLKFAMLQKVREPNYLSFSVFTFTPELSGLPGVINIELAINGTGNVPDPGRIWIWLRPFSTNTTPDYKAGPSFFNSSFLDLSFFNPSFYPSISLTRGYHLFGFIKITERRTIQRSLVEAFGVGQVRHASNCQYHSFEPIIHRQANYDISFLTSIGRSRLGNTLLCLLKLFFQDWVERTALDNSSVAQATLQFSPPVVQKMFVITEYRQHTFTNALSSIGGLLAILQGLHVLFFGRPLFWGLFGLSFIRNYETMKTHHGQFVRVKTPRPFRHLWKLLKQ